MTQTTPSTLVIGAGVAGMAAALSLAGQGRTVHLVEKSARPGGHAARWACMATDTCKNCGACLSIDMVKQIAGQDNIISHLATEPETISKTGSGYDIRLKTAETFSVDNIIMATGFSPFDTTLTPSFHHDAFKNVITTAELNTLLQQETLDDVLGKNDAPRIAFIQCVGSRNRSLGRDYCSQVCCKISMRHAQKLHHLYPDAAITLFYMDLQVIGKETRTLFNSMEGNIHLIQGVPAEILKKPDQTGVSIVTESPETGKRQSQAFDMVVLSVGMQPAENPDLLDNLPGLQPNPWGFFNNDDAVVPEGIIIAGCAGGPKDILSAIQDGRTAAAKIMAKNAPKRNKKTGVAVIGDGPCADAAAAKLSRLGFDTRLFGCGKTLPGDAPVIPVKDADIISISGTMNNFSIFYKTPSGKQSLTCAAIVAAQKAARTPAAVAALEDITGLETFAQLVEKNPGSIPADCVILLDYFGHENKASARSALELALEAKKSGKNTRIICNKMLVHGPEGQLLYDSAKQQGVDFFRFNTPSDVEIKKKENKFLLTVKEASLFDIRLDIETDMLVLPPVISAPANAPAAAALLKQPLDREGFLQSANVRHRPTQSPRAGIFFAGTGHDETDAADLDREIDEIAAAIAALDKGGAVADPGVEINQKTCAQCLTCIRVCPHGAIVINEKKRPEIVPEACFSCHMCVSNCPAYAIESKEYSNEQVRAQAQKDQVVILACRQSAALAAQPVKLPPAARLVPVPCACRISPDIILGLLVNGASKVMALGCHEENCRSLTGSRSAASGVQKVLNVPGIDSSRVIWEPVAANETRKFERIISKA